MAQALELFKPASESDGRPFIGTQTQTSSVSIVTPDGRRIQMTADPRAARNNNYVSGFRSPVPANQIPPGSTVVNDDTGTLLFQQPLSNPLQRLDGPDPANLRASQGPGNLAGGQGSGGDQLVAPPITADPSGLFAPQVTSRPIPLREQDIFATAERAGERNIEQLIQSFGTAREISRENFAEARRRIREINEFNRQQQAEAFAAAVPGGEALLNQNIRNLEAFARGRLPSVLENEILAQTQRAQAATQAGIVGGGIASSFGQRIGSQLAIRERIGLQETALARTPQFLASALQLRAGTPQRAVFDPNETARIAGDITNLTALTPAQAIQSEFQNIANLTAVEKFNELQRQEAEKFNQIEQAQLQETLLGFDLFNQREQQNFTQRVINAQAGEAAVAEAGLVAQEARERGEEAAGFGAAAGIVAGIGQVAGAVGAAVDAFTPDAPEVAGEAAILPPQPVQSTVLPDGSAGVVFDNGTVAPAPQGVVQVPVATVPPVDSTGTAVFQSPEAVASTTLPDGSAGIILPDGNIIPDYETATLNFEPTLTETASASYKTARLDVPISEFARLSTNSTFRDDQAIQAHRAARTNTPVLLAASNERPSAEQILYADGETGINLNRPANEIVRVESPVPINITRTITGGEAVLQASDIKNAIKIFDTASRVPRPTPNSPFFRNSQINQVSYPVVARQGTSVNDLGAATFDNIYNKVGAIPISNVIPRDANNEMITEPIFYAALVADDLIGA